MTTTEIIEEIEVEIIGAINQFTKSYKNAEDWSANYLNDTMEARKRMQKIPEKIRTTLTSFRQSILDEAIAVLPEEREEDPDMLGHDYLIKGYTNCRTQTLTNIENLKSK